LGAEAFAAEENQAVYLLILSMWMWGCGGKNAPAPAVETAMTEPAPEPEPEPEPGAPPPKQNNADFTVSITFSNGTTKSGRVIRIERSVDHYGEDGWSMSPTDLKISADGGTEYKKLTWKEVRSIPVRAGSIPADVNCFYLSDYTPWMYECNLKTPATMTDTSGKRWTVDSPHKWRLTFDNDEEVEFWLKKHHARQQDQTEVDLDTVNPENTDLYVQLQQQLRATAKSDLVLAIKVQ